MAGTTINQLITGMKMIATATSPSKLASLHNAAISVADIPGFAAECGVYQGGSLKVIAEALPDKVVYGFDTFSGLPKQYWSKNEIHKPREFGETSLALVKENLKGFNNIELRSGQFPESAKDLGDARFAFVYLDMDFYLSTRMALEWFMKRMSKGGKIVLDDYEWPHCPGVKQAVDELNVPVISLNDYQVVACF